VGCRKDDSGLLVSLGCEVSTPTDARLLLCLDLLQGVGLCTLLHRLQVLD
jgi:hypothetical protein